MFSKTQSATPGYVHVVFELPAATWADHVSLTGDFNQWDKSQTLLFRRAAASGAQKLIYQPSKATNSATG